MPPSDSPEFVGIPPNARFHAHTDHPSAVCARTFRAVRRIITLPALAAIALAGAVLVGCGGSAPEATPLTSAQARLLANAQYMNFRKKGAKYEMQVGVAGTPSHFTMTGQMNWAGLVGFGVVTRDGAAPVEVWWRTDVVVQSDPQLAMALRAAGRPPVYVSHTPNPQANPIDKACAILMHLGSRRRENPQLVRQQKGSAYLGDEDVRGTPTQILRYGEINRFWIDPGTGLMQRFVGDNAAGKAPQIVDLLSHAAQTIYAPPGTVVPERTAQALAKTYGVAPASP